MTLLVKLALIYAAFFAFLVLFAAAAVVYYDIVRPFLDRRRSRIASPTATTFVEDPFPSRRYGHPLEVIGGSGAGSTTSFLDEDDER